MSLPFSEFSGQFFWDFKKMDNVNYNFEIVSILYKAKKQNGDSQYFNKPILVILVSMIECMLYDFTNRINGFRWDSFPNVTSAMVSYIRGLGETDEMKKLIERCRVANLLQVDQNNSLYDDLITLNKIRNRLHIQNKHSFSHKDERHVFTSGNLALAENSFKTVCEILCNVYPRWGKTPLPMSDFPEPWK